MDIKKITDIPNINLAPKHRAELNRRKPAVQYENAKDAYKEFLPKDFFKDTKVGRFLSLRSRAGKTVAGIAAAVGSSFLPAPIGPIVGKVVGAFIPTATNQIGVPMEFLNGDIIEIILIVLTVGLGIAATFLQGKVKQLLLRLQAVVKELKVGKELYDDFKSKESAGGTSLTGEEYKALAEQLGTIIKMLFDSNEEVIKDAEK